MDHFVGRLETLWLPDNRSMRLLQDFAYLDRNGVVWTAPKGSEVDGASIPRAFWTVIGGPFEGPYRVASVIHDVYCVTRTKPWTQTHRMFHEACLRAGCDLLQARVMYAGVFHFGPRWSLSSEGLAAPVMMPPEPTLLVVRGVQEAIRRNPHLGPDEIERLVIE